MAGSKAWYPEEAPPVEVEEPVRLGTETPIGDTGPTPSTPIGNEEASVPEPTSSPADTIHIRMEDTGATSGSRMA